MGFVATPLALPTFLPAPAAPVPPAAEAGGAVLALLPPGAPASELEDPVGVVNINAGADVSVSSFKEERRFRPTTTDSPSFERILSFEKKPLQWPPRETRRVAERARVCGV